MNHTITPGKNTSLLVLLVVSVTFMVSLLMISSSGVSAKNRSADAVASVLQQQPDTALTFEKRVECQKAIDAVYWNHQIWPKENKQAKPPFEKVMNEETLRIKVEDTLKKSNALAYYWKKPVTESQLQAEIDRIARNTKDSKLLKELWTALGNDPLMIAECLARPVLVERLMTNWYDSDQRFHSDMKKGAETELNQSLSADAMRRMSGKYVEIEWIKLNSQAPAAIDDVKQMVLDEKEWAQFLEKLAQDFGVGTAKGDVANLPVGKVSRLNENRNGFYAMALLDKTADRIKIASVNWTKKPVDQWWNEVKGQFQLSVKETNFAFTLPEITFHDCEDNTWKEIGIELRLYHSVVWTGSTMIIWGGYNGSNVLSTGGIYTPATDSWTHTSTSGSPSPRSNHTAVWTGQDMIVWGGWDNASTNYNTGGRYNPSANLWSPTNTTGAPLVRHGHSAVWTGNEMIVWGGLAGSTNYNTGGRYNPSTNLWVPTSITSVPASRADHSAIWTGSEMIVWGGSSGTTCNSSGGRYDPGSDTWSATLQTTAPQARKWHTAVWTGAVMIIWGGHNCSAAINSGSRYDPSTNTWTGVSGIGVPNARYNHTAIWDGTDQMIVWGGFNGVSYFNDGAKYAPDSNSWTLISSTNAPATRAYHTAIWTGTGTHEMIVWGGKTLGNILYNSGGRYNETGDSWTATSFAGAPAARNSHTAVWNGTDVLVWGGWDGIIYFNNGGRYNKATDSWNTMSTTNAPTARILHTAVWIGTKMCVWGGYDGATALNSGGCYDPAGGGGGTWAPTFVTSAPTQRYYHTVVWSGTRMIVWGGYDGTNYFNTGSQYDPVGNSWSDTTTTNAPLARAQHTVVWDEDNEMIVWGGWNGTSFFNTGARYNPTNSWITMTTVNVPAARNRHTTLWSGLEMIVWGGADASTYFNTGAKYLHTATTDSWIATSTTNAPPERYGHTAIWNGDQMVIWGGTPLTNSGGRYYPEGDVWTATSTANAPLARDRHIAVMAGSEMIVWGGYYSSNLDTGGRYCSIFCSAPTFSGVTFEFDTDGCQYSGIQANWSVPTDWGTNAGPGTYDVIRYTNNICTLGAYTVANDLLPTVVSQVDITPAHDIAYYYQIVAKNDCNPPVSTTGLNSCAGPIYDRAGSSPTGLANNTAVDSGSCADTGVLITWQANPGNQETNWKDNGAGNRYYEVLRDGAPATIPPLPYQNTPATVSFIDTGGTNNQTYLYAVRYINGCLMSAATTGASAKDSTCTLVSNKPTIGTTDPNYLILEPGTTPTLKGCITNTGGGIAQLVTGALTADGKITVTDSAAIYPTINPGATQCCSGTGCYQVSVPVSRPIGDYDTTITETSNCTGCSTLAYNFDLHIGKSFTDVLPANTFYLYIETVLHNGVTSGCTTAEYCPANSVQRQAMAKFICAAMNAADPGCCPTQASCQDIFTDVPASNAFCIYIEALYALGTVSGCSTSPLMYCPANLVTRAQMAKFICNAMNACTPGSCNTVACTGIFQDVPTSNAFCSYIEALYTATIVSGCSTTPLNYCPANLVTRGQMAKFLVNAFGFHL